MSVNLLVWYFTRYCWA